MEFACPLYEALLGYVTHYQQQQPQQQQQHIGCGGRVNTAAIRTSEGGNDLKGVMGHMHVKPSSRTHAHDRGDSISVALR